MEGSQRTAEKRTVLSESLNATSCKRPYNACDGQGKSRGDGVFLLAKLMSEKKEPYVVDDFMNKIRSHPGCIAAMQTDPTWVRRVDDLEAVLHALFVSDDGRAIEMSDEVRSVIERKHVSLEKRIAMIQQILRAGSIHVLGDLVRT